MEDQKHKYHRFSIRFKEYDYSQPGYYYFTLVTQNRDKRFGVIFKRKMQLNNVGHMINREWNQIPERFEYAVLDKYIIMPDHFHGIIKIIPNINNVGTPLVGIHPQKIGVYHNKVGIHPQKIGVHHNEVGIHPQKNGIHHNKVGIHPQKNGIHHKKMDIHPNNISLFEIIGAFKSITTHKYINGVKNKN